jgi:serine/threonine protein kinase
MEENKTLSSRYVLEAEIGRGGMGTVYRARDLQLDRLVAIKVLPHEFTRDTQFLARFKTEVLNTAKLQHPYIVSVYDVGIDGDTYYYVMQLIEGQDLKSLMSQPDRLSDAVIIKYLEQVANALDFAHANGIIHRDIKPENILIDKYGIARVTDFGIARSLEGTRMTSGMIGTPEYMSPEQAQGNDVDGRSDQYSLAIVAYEMFTGTTPFNSSSSQPWAVVNKHINEVPPNPRQFSNDVSEVISASLLKALAKKAEERFVSCIDFISSLSSSVPVKLVVKDKTKHRSSVLVIVMTMLLTGMVVGGGVLLFKGNSTVNPPPPPQIPPDCILMKKSLEQSTVTVTPSATDDKAVIDITIYWGTGESQQGCVSDQSYSYTYLSKDVAKDYVIYAKATDSDNLTATSSSFNVNIPATVPDAPPPPVVGDYFVILGSFKHSDRVKADKCLERIQSNGYPDSYIINSDEYPKLTPGLWVVVMGPYAKEIAQAKKTEMKAYVSSCYIKSGK